MKAIADGIAAGQSKVTPKEMAAASENGSGGAPAEETDPAEPGSRACSRGRDRASRA